MSGYRHISRRQFLSTAATSTAVSFLSRPALSSASARIFSSAGLFDAAGAAASLPWQDQSVINTAKSPFAKLRGVPVRAVTIEQGFWSKRRSTNVEKSIPTMREELEAHGRMSNFRRLVGKSSAPQIGPYFSDSDVYKWIDAVGWALQSGDRPELRRLTDALVHDVVAIQEPRGYLNTYYHADRASLRMSQHDQEVGHEMYCLGHMIQAAISYYRATGDRTLMDAGARMIDNFVIPNYGPGPNQKPIISGHPEIEMALIELYRTTGRKQYVDLAGYILHGDDRWKIEPDRVAYMFCGIPFTSRTRLEGHAVRAMYACCGATDYYLETGDPAYWETLNKLWEDLTRRQMYITGGVGARAAGEAFGDPYELPNAQAYGESCAAIGNMMWNWRMLAASGEAKFADVIERALYNGINSGMSLDGTTYCYRNPLAFDPSSGDKIRNPWYDVTCCPPNIERTLASLPGMFYSTSKDGLYVHLYDNSLLDWHLEDGTPIQVRQKTGYPWDGDVQLTVTPSGAREFTFNVRIPGWADGTSVVVNGKPLTGARPGEYLAIHRNWKPGDTVRLSFPIGTEVVAANPRVAENRGRVAVRRGPMIYCMEEIDQPKGIDLADVSLTVNRELIGKEFTSEFKPDLLGGIVVLHSRGEVLASPPTDKELYSPVNLSAPKTRSENVSFIPYYVWANREPCAMEVWVPYMRT